MPYLTRQVRFSASHQYWNPQLNEVENLNIFKQSTHIHGHNYIVELSVYGDINPETGMIINFLDLDPVIKEVILEPLDHKNLNSHVSFLKDKIPTLENLALFVWENLAPRINELKLTLSNLKIIENNDLYLEYDGSMVAL